ncbi:hypothetical protein HKX48_004174 [Thoreauomyces humboldtii]|nr:hypothetical protein HKX48_004174 [Thoreauomyces humboldtii]
MVRSANTTASLVPKSSKIFTRLAWASAALMIQLLLLLLLSYNPTGLTQLVNTHVWSKVKEVESPSQSSSNPASDIMVESDVLPQIQDQDRDDDASSSTPVVESPSTDRTGVRPVRAGRKKTLPTDIRQRPWATTGTSDRLCGGEQGQEGSGVPRASDLAVLTDANHRGALVFPTVSRTALTKAAGSFSSHEINLPVDAGPLCAWLVVVDWGDGLAETPFHAQTGSEARTEYPTSAGDWPPDSVEIRASGSDYTVPVSVGKKYVLVKGRPSEVAYRIYNVTIDLRDPDSYLLEPVLEYVDYLWNYEQPEHVFWSPTPLPIYVDISDLHHVPSLHLSTKSLPRITHTSYGLLPPCTSGDQPGRWIPTSHLSPMPSVRMQIPSDDSDPATDEIPLILDTRSRRLWVPYTCRYVAKTYASWRDTCLSVHHPRIDAFGDANLRRSAKAMASGGRWCTVWYEQGSRDCECSDWGLNVEGLVPDRDENLVRVSTNEEEDGWVTRGDMSQVDTLPSMFVFLWKGLNDWGPDWRRALSNSTDRMMSAGNDVRGPSAVVISLTNWDAAFGTYEAFVRSLEDLVKLVGETYHARGIPVIWRSGQYFGGRADLETSDGGMQTRKYSRMRVKAFNQAAERALVDAFQAKVWDVYSIGEGLDATERAQAAECISGHSGRHVVDVENTMLLNMLCPQ